MADDDDVRRFVGFFEKMSRDANREAHREAKRLSESREIEVDLDDLRE